jgi:hypothetical protein
VTLCRENSQNSPAVVEFSVAFIQHCHLCLRIPNFASVFLAALNQMEAPKRGFLPTCVTTGPYGSYLGSRHSQHTNPVYHLIYCSRLPEPQAVHILRGGPSIGHGFRRKFEASTCNTRINLTAGSDPIRNSMD